jgi:hypothetical protein
MAGMPLYMGSAQHSSFLHVLFKKAKRPIFYWTPGSILVWTIQPGTNRLAHVVPPAIIQYTGCGNTRLKKKRYTVIKKGISRSGAETGILEIEPEFNLPVTGIACTPIFRVAGILYSYVRNISLGQVSHAAGLAGAGRGAIPLVVILIPVLGGYIRSEFLNVEPAAVGITVLYARLDRPCVHKCH